MKRKVVARSRRVRPRRASGARGRGLFREPLADRSARGAVEGRGRQLRRFLTGYPMAAALLACYWVMAVTSVRDKSTTFDEIVHLPAGCAYWKYNDYRLNPENGNLPQRWMAIPLLLDDYKFPSIDQPDWRESRQWNIGREFFYGLGNNLEGMLWRGRAMMALLGVALGLAVYVWSRRLFGPGGGIISLVVYAFDPTMLAHGRLMTSDMTAALFFLLSVGSLWVMLHRVSPLTLLCSCLAMAGVLLAKMSGVLVVPMALLLVAIRLIRRRPLTVAFGRARQVERRWRQAVVLLGAVLAHAAVVVVLIWASYGFRYSIFRPTSVKQDQLSKPWSSLLAEGGPVNSAVRFSRDHRLLPEGYLYGFAFVNAHSRGRLAFFRGQYSVRGWRTFFPYCFGVKTPLPIMGVLILAGVVVGLKYRSARTRKSPSVWLSVGGGLYRTAPLWVLLTVYWVFAVFAHINIGHRHILPTYPPLYVLAGAAGYWFLTRLRWMHALVGLLLAALVAESAVIRPHYLAYFNQSVGGPSKGYRCLVDSSLDWGQDLPGLKRWLDRNVSAREAVYFSYFGSGSPEYYQIRATPLPGFPMRGRMVDVPALGPGLYCISATMVQTVLIRPWGRWTAEYERAYQATRSDVRHFAATQGDSDARRRLIDARGKDYWESASHRFNVLRFARLCAYLRRREPDDSVGYSILIYRLTDKDIHRALNGPPPDGTGSR